MPAAPARTLLGRLRRDRLALAGAAATALIAGLALAAPLLFPGDPLDMAARPLTPPFASWRVPLGTDRLGRDLLAGVVHGARASLAIGVVAALLAAAIGTALGTLAGFYGGRVDEALMRVVETFQIVPGFLLALALVAALGPSQGSAMVAVAMISWTQTARVVRAEVMALRARDFVRAAVALGAGNGRIMLRHVLPNTLPPVIALATMTVAVAILVESALAFLGLGDANVASWGGMIAGGRALLRTAWYVSAVPGVAIAATVLAVTALGEGLTAALDPRRTARR